MTTDTPASAGSAGERPALDAVQARILGCLIEKEATTPEAYPLTANAVVLACNQKSNRDPIMELEAGAVGHALREMESEGLVKSVHGARAQRYEHRFAQAYSVTAKQQALLCVLLLRGPQTAAELHARSDRLASFADLDEVRQTLERLAQRSPALAINLGRAPGQREDRYMHLLAGPVDAAHLLAAIRSDAPAPREDLAARVDALAGEIESLRAEIEALKQRLP